MAPTKLDQGGEQPNGRPQEPQVPHVCVVGAGICGIAAVKACLDEGLRVSCYDKSSEFGGLWCYRPDGSPTDEGPFEPSVMRTTILNTSKELSAFSDFPPAAELPNFMKHNLYMDYIRAYVAHFKLSAHFKLRHEVLHCRPEWNAELRQIKWLVRVRCLDGPDGAEEPPAEIRFDRLMVAVGHHNIPYAPALPNQRLFGGQIVHSARLKDIITSGRFVDKRVLVIGLGNSACDAANDISLVSAKCYLSSHRGQWFTSRYLASGPYDFYVKSRFYNYASKLVPRRLLDGAIVSRLEQRTNHQMLGLRPKHAPSEQVPAINDLLPYKIYTGGVCLKGPVETFTKRGVVFEGEQGRECQVDVVVLATGYIGRVAFLDERALGLRSGDRSGDQNGDDGGGAAEDGQQPRGEYDLFLNIFAPKLKLPPPAGGFHSQPTIDCCSNGNSIKANQRLSSALVEVGEQTKNKQKQALSSSDNGTPQEAIKSLAFIGLVQPNGSLTLISELQSRYVARVFAGKLELPSQKRMAFHMDKMRRVRAGAVRSHSRDQLIGSYVDYADTIARLLGVRPDMKRLLLKDFALWKQLMFGPSVSYQYRLSGPGEWAEARETILRVNERISCGINEGNNEILYKIRRKRLQDDLQNKARVRATSNRPEA